MLSVYLAGEIHTNWREEIAEGAQNFNVMFTSPVTDHEASDDCGVKIMGSEELKFWHDHKGCLLYTSPSPRDRQKSRMPSSA